MSLAEVILMGLLVAIFLFATLRSLWRLLRNKRADLHAASEDLEDVSWQELIVEGIVPSVLFACLYWWLYFVPKVEGLMGFDIWVMLAFIPFYRMVLRGIRSRLFPILCGFRPP